MNIAYYSCYLGPETCKICGIPYKPASNTLKTQGIARALLYAGHKVTIYSPGCNFGHKVIPAHTEAIVFPEGKLIVKYPKQYSYPKMTPINDLSLLRMVSKDSKCNNYDAFIYYNICDNACLGGFTHLHQFKHVLRILEYEDNIFMKSLVGNKGRLSWLKSMIYKYAIKRTDGLFAVCKGMYDEEPIRYKLLTPGIINQEVVNNVSPRVNILKSGQPVKIFLAGGAEYYKGSDLLIQSLNYIKYSCELHFFTTRESFYAVAKNAIDQLPKIHQVIIHDPIPHDQLIKLLDAEADILANSTLGFGMNPTRAGFPSKMMEYAALGRPIVSSEIGKLDEEFSSKVTYYEGENAESIAKCIEEIIENYDEKERLSLELQKIALSQYTIAGTGEKMKKFFENIPELNGR